MIDINQPVEHNHDLIINEGGDQHMGTPEEFNKKAAEGLLTGVHFDNQQLQAEEAEEAQEDETSSKVRDSKGHFVKAK